MLQTVNRWLPPPRLLRVAGLGVDISESSIKYLGLAPSRSGLFALSLAEYGEVAIPPGVLSRGEVNDVSKLAAALREVKQRTGKTYIRLSLPEERAYLFEAEVDPMLSEKEIRQQLEFRLEENVPLSPRDAYFDFQWADSPAAVNQRTVAVTVCARELVDAYYEACRLARLVPLSFEIEPTAIARAALPRYDRGTRVLLDFGKTRTGFGIVHNGTLLYASTIDIGGDDLSKALRRHVGERDEADLTKLKNEIGLVKDNDGRGVSEALLPVVASIKDEIHVRMSYWDDANGRAHPIDHIIVTGGSANLRGLTAYLSETLTVEAVLADIWQNAFDSKLHAPAIDRRHSYGYATAMGLALTSFV